MPQSFVYVEAPDGAECLDQGRVLPWPAFTVRCASNKHRWAECPVDIAGSVELRKQESHAPCVRGWTWGTMGRDGIWVSDGCRGRFLVDGRQSNRQGSGADGYAPPGVQRVQPR